MRWQLPIVWLVSSVVTGTIAVLFTTGRGYLPFKPLTFLGGPAALTLVVLVAAFVLALFALGWRTIGETWLRWQDPRSAMLWTILVAGGGFVGWGFAAAVTLDAGFSLTAQLILAYTCGGLPFTLVAGMLARPWRVNMVAAALTVVALVTGLTMMETPLLTLVMYLEYLVTPAFRPS
jgi:hypothetical protein